MNEIRYVPAAVALASLSWLVSMPVLAQSWTDSIAVKGDLRLRYEGIDEDGEADRDRGRFRARLGLTADVNDKVSAVLQFATGGDNPVSTNQSFDDGFSRKDIGLDLAYLDWTPNDRTHVYGGKMKNPFQRAGGHALVWDSDLNPEGVAIGYASGGFFGAAGLMFVEERSSQDDSLLFGLQGGYRFELGGDSALTAGVSYYDYSDTVGNSPFYDESPAGNTVDAEGNLMFDYSQVELYAEWLLRLGGQPFSVFGDYVENTEADSEESGYAFGVALGDADEPGTWEASVAYQDLEADAVIGTFTDSDFGGGGTDASGFTIKGKYALADNWALAGTLFLNEVDEAAGNEHDYTRLQLDLEFSF